MRYVVAPSPVGEGLVSRTFQAVVSYAEGSLANAWGAQVYRFDEGDLTRWPLTGEDLKPYYDQATEIVGISGDRDDLTPFHGSTEGRFHVTYCPGKLSRADVESVGFKYADPADMEQRYDPATLREGWNDVGGERVFFIANPGLALWALRSRFPTMTRPAEDLHAP